MGSCANTLCFQGWRETKEPNGGVVLWTIPSSWCTWRYAPEFARTSLLVSVECLSKYLGEWCSYMVLAVCRNTLGEYSCSVCQKVCPENMRLNVNVVNFSSPGRLFWYLSGVECMSWSTEVKGRCWAKMVAKTDYHGIFSLLKVCRSQMTAFPTASVWRSASLNKILNFNYCIFFCTVSGTDNSPS